MTGPEHYKRAEELLRKVEPEANHGDGSPVVFDDLPSILAAQVHATLVLAGNVADLVVSLREGVGP